MCTQIQTKICVIERVFTLGVRDSSVESIITVLVIYQEEFLLN
jgi:hypothetical protein